MATPPIAAETKSMPASASEKLPADDRRDGHPEGHQGGRVVEEALALDDAHHAAAGPRAGA